MKTLLLIVLTWMVSDGAPTENLDHEEFTSTMEDQELAASSSSSPLYKNLALHGRATQSSLPSDSVQYGFLSMAINAIDGNQNADFYRGSCTHTNNDYAPWWRVDLLNSYRINRISITNRNSCAERLNGAEILVGDSLSDNGNNNPRCAVVTAIPPGVTQTFECNDMVGRYVNVIVRGRYEYLHLCEVQVFGAGDCDGTRNASDPSPCPPPTAQTAGSPWNRGCRPCERIMIGPAPGGSVAENLDHEEFTSTMEDQELAASSSSSSSSSSLHCNKNLALHGRATQSSLPSDFNYGYLSLAINAIDGNQDADFAHGSCTHTNNDFAPWWRVDLLSSYRINRITITNRKDCCAQRLNGAEILVGDSLSDNGNNNPRCAVVTAIPHGVTQTFQCNDMVGRYVNVIVRGRKEYLHMCEVQVFGA
ncbi:uncharacterized protein [Dendrobates tinctorius]|uniref:uncharacterized protein n=1 Tax=Dendrobates tinctorius TaxID=92724 RepID=UPI003CC94823